MSAPDSSPAEAPHCRSPTPRRRPIAWLAGPGSGDQRVCRLALIVLGGLLPHRVTGVIACLFYFARSVSCSWCSTLWRLLASQWLRSASTSTETPHPRSHCASKPFAFTFASTVIPLIEAMIVVIDNYDSFTYNLVRSWARWAPSAKIEVFATTRLRSTRLSAEPPSYRDSPRPVVAAEGESARHHQVFWPKLPVLVCGLGHQCIGFTPGPTWCGPIVMHGKTRPDPSRCARFTLACPTRLPLRGITA